VRISVVKGADWRALPRGDVRPEWVQSLALLPDGNLVYPVRNLHRIQIVTPDGKLVREFGEPGDKPGQLGLPAAVATDKDGLIYVTESGNSRVQVFDAQGKSLRVIAPTGQEALKQPCGVAVDGQDRVWVADQGNNRLVCFGKETQVVGGPGAEPGKFNKPMHLSIIQGKLYVADSGNKRIQIIDPANPQAPPQVVPMPQPVKSVQYDGQGRFVVAGDRLTTFDQQWKPVGEFDGVACGRPSPDYATYDAAGNILVADGWNSRILTLAPTLTDVTPAVSDLTGTSAVITWQTPLPAPSKLLLLDTPVGAVLPPATDYSKARTFGDGQMRTAHRVELSGLKPGTRCTYALVAPVKAIPPLAQSVDYRFATEAPAGQMAYSEVPLAVLCYMNVTLEGQKKPDGSPADPVTRQDDWFEKQIKYHEAMRYFYFSNSMFRLDTKCKYLKVARPVDLSNLGSSGEEVARDLAELATREGLKPTDFGAVIVVGGSGYFAYPWPTPWWGGQLSHTTGCCFIGGGDTWLATHEFHHLTEGWMSMINYPGCFGAKEPYASADGPWRHKGRFGENYDFLAHTLRAVAPSVYLNLAVGKLKLTADKDGDGVPDDEPNVVFDEQRAGTRPDSKESYGNGLTDLQNLTAEVFNPATPSQKHPRLTKQVDLKYPFAVFNYGYERKKKTPVIDGKLTPGEWDEFAATPNAITPYRTERPWGQAYPPAPGADYRMQTYLNWDDEHLYFAAKAPFKFGTSIELDCSADGYFHGKDNVKIGVELPRDESKAAPNTILPPPGVMVWNNVEPVQQRDVPDWDNALFDQKDKIQWAWGKADDGGYVVEVAIPKCANVGLVPAAGKELGVRLWIQGFLPPTPENPDPRYAFEMFDSCEYGYFTLAP
jgi:DNA-binding beta-propeller fold protein YncE